MYPVVPLLALADEVAVAVASAPFATLTALVPNIIYMFASSTACWLRQGSAWLVTCVSKANSAAGDYFTITLDGTAVLYGLDVAGTGVPAGRTQIDISGATTAASVATLVRTAILATQATLSVTDNGDGTLTIVKSGSIVTVTENVVNAGFLAATTTLVASAADGNMFAPANLPFLLDGRYGAKVSVIRDAADGKASLTPVRM